LDQMKKNKNDIELNVDTFNNLIGIHLKSSDFCLDESVKIFYQMIKEYDIQPNSDTFAMLFTLCARKKEIDICLNLLSFMIKYCVQTVEVSNALISAFIHCCIECEEKRLAMKFYEDMFLFGDNYGMNNKNDSKSKWELSELNRFNRSSTPNIQIFVHLLDCNKNAAKGMYGKNIVFIQNQMKKYNVSPDVEFYRKLLRIADSAEQGSEVQKLSQLVLRNMSKRNVENDRDTLELMMTLLHKYEFYENSKQIYDYCCKELQMINHWKQNDNADMNADERQRQRRKRRRNRVKIKGIELAATKEDEMNLSALDARIGCVAIHYVLSSEWRDYSKDLFVRVSAKNNRIIL